MSVVEPPVQDGVVAPPPEEPAAPRSPARDLLFGFVTVGLALGALIDSGFGARGLIDAFFLAVLVVLSAIDIERHILPNRIVLPAAGVVLVANLAFFSDSWLEWIVAPVGAAAALFLIRLLHTEGLGMGDVKLVLLLGAGLGKAVVAALIIGTLAAGLVGIGLFAVHGSAARKMAIPYGPFLAFGAAVAVFLS